MTKIEELKAAYEAATLGASITYTSNGVVSQAIMSVEYQKFIDLAHNLMPQLLEAVEALEICKHYLEKLSDQGDKGAASAWAGVVFTLEKLK